MITTIHHPPHSRRRRRIIIFSGFRRIPTAAYYLIRFVFPENVPVPVHADSNKDVLPTASDRSGMEWYHNSRVSTSILFKCHLLISNIICAPLWYYYCLCMTNTLFIVPTVIKLYAFQYVTSYCPCTLLALTAGTFTQKVNAFTFTRSCPIKWTRSLGFISFVSPVHLYSHRNCYNNTSMG